MSFSSTSGLDNIGKKIFKHDYVMPISRIEGDPDFTYYNSYDVCKVFADLLNGDEDLLNSLKRRVASSDLVSFGKFRVYNGYNDVYSISLQYETKNASGMVKVNSISIGVSNERMHFSISERSDYPDVPEIYVAALLKICDKFRDKLKEQLNNIKKKEEEEEIKRREKYEKMQQEIDELLKKKGLTREQVDKEVREKSCSSCWNSFPWTTENIYKCYLGGCSGYSYYNGD